MDTQDGRIEISGNLALAQSILDRAESAGRPLTDAEHATVAGHIVRAKTLKAEISAAKPEDEQKRRDAELKAALGNMFGGMAEVGVSVDGNARGGNLATKGGSWADAFEKEIRGRGHGSKALMEPTGAVSVPGIIDGLTPLSEKVETILQLIPWSKLVGTDAFSYLQETVRTHNADVVPTGCLKPTSIYTVERIDDHVRTIAHLSEPIPRSYLSDISLLTEYIRMVLSEGYNLELEQQIISGPGGDDFTGILNTAAIQVCPWDTDLLRTCRQAVTMLEVVPITPGAFVFHPEDWQEFELLTNVAGFELRDATQSLPIDRARRRLWGYPVALSLGIAQGTGLLVDFRGSTKGWERESVTVDWSEAFHIGAGGYDEQDTTGFETNQVKFRCEGRAGFAVRRPAGVVEIDLEAGS